MNQQFISLNLIKKHLNIEEDFTEDDQLIGLYADTAVETIEKHLDLKETLGELYDEHTLPSAIKNVMLLLIGELYKRREMSTTETVNDTKIFGYLIGLHRNLSV